jgi:outer membrane lipoprotein-sorting protein
MVIPRFAGPLLAIALVATSTLCRPESVDARPPAALSATQIVDRMQSRDLERTQDLTSYKTLRHYEVVYRGFSSKVEARMDVAVDYDRASGKNLVIVSQSGSKFLLEKVLKRAVDSEREAFQQRKSTALTTANYRFRLLGQETLEGRSAYVLQVEPLVPSKFLYRGKIWVDAADFATVKMETEPAKSPSFWISRTRIHYTGVKTNGFWMPRQVVSETSVRVGGIAVLTIDYGNYQISSNPPPVVQAALRP